MQRRVVTHLWVWGSEARAGLVVTKARQAGQHQVYHANVQRHAAQQEPIVRGQGAGVKHCLEHTHGHGGQGAGLLGCQDLA